MNFIPKNLIGPILISASAFIFAAWVLPTYDSIPAINKVIGERTESLASREKIIEKVLALGEEYKKRSDDLTRASLIIPEKASVPEMISTAQEILSKSGLQPDSFSINPSVNSDLPYNNVALNTTSKGDYLALLNFLNHLERSLRLIDVSLLDVSIEESVKGPSVLTFSIKSSAYFLKEVSDTTKVKEEIKKSQRTSTDQSAQ